MNKSREGIDWEARCRKLVEEMHKQRPTIKAVYDRDAWDLVEEIFHNESSVKKLPTLPDYIKEHGWPDWAKYAVVDGSGGMDGRPVFSDSQLSLIENEKFEYKGWRHTSDNTESYDNVFLDTTNWQNSLVEKCDLCSGTGLIGQGQPFGTVGVVKSICPTCNGTKIKPKQEPNHTELPNLKGLQCSNCNTKFPVRYKYCQNCGIKLSEEPKLKSLADEPWPDPNEGCSSRKVEDGNLKYFNQFLQEWHLVGTGYQDASQEKNPRYDDILWLRKWKGKKIMCGCGEGDVDDPHEVKGLSPSTGCFLDQYGQHLSIKKEAPHKWIEVKDKPKRVPLTAKDFQNIRGIKSSNWDDGLERRFIEVTKEGVIVAGCVMTFKGLMNDWLGITFDNKIVPLYKEE